MAHDGGQSCACVADHNPNAMELHRHHIRPLYLGGADTAENVVYNCPTTHANTHEILRALMAGQPVPANATRYARTLALEGMRRFDNQTHGQT